jgi:hypothetical protein
VALGGAATVCADDDASTGEKALPLPMLPRCRVATSMLPEPNMKRERARLQLYQPEDEDEEFWK